MVGILLFGIVISAHFMVPPMVDKQFTAVYSAPPFNAATAQEELRIIAIRSVADWVGVEHIGRGSDCDGDKMPC